MLKLKKCAIAIVAFMMVIGTTCAPVKVNASEITPYAYNDPSAVSFKSSYTGKSLYYDGNYMAFEATATASNTTKKYRTYTDGINRKADYIPIDNGSYVIISASCADTSVTINLDLKMYSWSE